MQEAGARCRPQEDETGEQSCPGGDSTDGEGWLLFPSQQSLAQLDAWIDALQVEEASDA